jgi:hypothetical protein
VGILTLLSSPFHWCGRQLVKFLRLLLDEHIEEVAAVLDRIGQGA